MLVSLLLTFNSCKKDFHLDQVKDDFKVNSFISNIKCYNVTADFNENLLPVDTGSMGKPSVTVQSWVVKGKDMLVSVTVPENATEIYFGAANPKEDYAGLHFEGEEQDTATGFYRLQLANINNPDSASNGFRNYMLVLSSNESIQLDQFDLLTSYNTPTGISNVSTTSVNVVSIAPYQKKLMVAFRPLQDYSYTITINSPSGTAFTYSYDKNTGAVTSSGAVSYDSQFHVDWIDLDPVFGTYNINANVTVDISGGGYYYVELFFIIYAEGTIDQVVPTLDVNNSGNTATIVGNVSFNYFDEYKSILANIIAYKPVNYEMLNPNQTNLTNENYEIVSENSEESPGVGLRTCQNCLQDFKFSKISLEVLSTDYTSNEVSFWLKSNSSSGMLSIWEEKNFNNLMLWGNEETELDNADFQNGYYLKNLWVTCEDDLEDAQLSFQIRDASGNILSEDIVKFYPVKMAILSLSGINTNILFGQFGHAWITIDIGDNLKNSYGFWPINGTLYNYLGFPEVQGIILWQPGDFDDGSIYSYDFSHSFYIYYNSLQSFYNYKSTIDNNPLMWNASYNCATFASTSVGLMGISIPIMNFPNDINDWITWFESTH